MKGFKQRFSTAVVFAFAMVLGVFGSKWTFLVLVLAIGSSCLWEFYGLLFNKSDKNLEPLKWTGIVMGCSTLLLTFFFHLGLVALPLVWIAVTLIVLMGFTSFLVAMYRGILNPVPMVGIVILGLFYIVVPLMFLIHLGIYDQQYHPLLVMLLFVLVWSNDSFAYLIGSKIGKNKLFPRISPGKTWEGTVGGGLLTLLLAALSGYFLPEANLLVGIGLGLAVAIFGTLGDLVESMLKRSIGVKDSGNLLPGHGGVLDRFDAFLFMLPYAGMVWLLFR